MLAPLALVAWPPFAASLLIVCTVMLILTSALLHGLSNES